MQRYNVPTAEMDMEELLLFFRSQYEELYYSTIGSEMYIWRVLTQQEYKHIVEFSLTEGEAFERVCQVAILFPEYDYVNEGLAYLPETLGADILDKSGYGKFSKDFDILEEYRAETQRFDKQAEIIINRAFSYITFDDMAGWTRTKLLKYLAKAEWSLQFIDRMEHIKLLSSDVAERLAAEGDDEEGEETRPLTQEEIIHRTAKNIRQRGGDPMLDLRALYKKPDPEYVDMPFIGGSAHMDGLINGIDNWKGGMVYGRFESIRESVQKVSARRG